MRGRERRDRDRERERISAMTAKQGLAGSLKETISVCSESLFHCVAITDKNNNAGNNSQHGCILTTDTKMYTETEKQ